MKNNVAYSNIFFDFIKNNITSDPVKLLFSTSKYPEPDLYRFAVVQIECRQKTSRKLSSLLNNDKFLFPSLLSAEQATHQCVAAYHSTLLGKARTIIDITAGLGIDVFTMARDGRQITAIELDSERVKFLKWNSEILGLDDISVVEDDSIRWIEENRRNTHFDVLFADPARRDKTGARTYFLGDCLPDVVSHFNLLADIADKIIIKASPILDIDSVISDLAQAAGKRVVSEIHPVCVKGECKEVLIICEPQIACPDTEIVVADLKDSRNGECEMISRFSIMHSQCKPSSKDQIAEELQPGQYLYDPNSGVHKVNCSHRLCETYPGLRRLSPNTDLYVSDTSYDDFPGRKFRIDRLLNKADMKSLKGENRDIATRNYPMSADQLRARLKTHSSADRYIFGCRVGNKSVPTLIDVTKQ